MTRSRLAAAVLVGTALYAVAIYLVVTADLGEPRALITMVTVAGLIFSVAGTIAAIQRPDNRTGAQMLAVGLLWSVGALQLADSSLVFTIGYLLSGLAFVAFAHLILSYPSGRLRPGDEWIVWAVLAIVTLGPLAISLFDRSPIPACDDCPESAFLVTALRWASPPRESRQSCSSGSSGASAPRRRRSAERWGPCTSSR